MGLASVIPTGWKEINLSGGNVPISPMGRAIRCFSGAGNIRWKDGFGDDHMWPFNVGDELSGDVQLIYSTANGTTATGVAVAIYTSANNNG